MKSLVVNGAQLGNVNKCVSSIHNFSQVYKAIFGGLIIIMYSLLGGKNFDFIFAKNVGVFHSFKLCMAAFIVFDMMLTKIICSKKADFLILMLIWKWKLFDSFHFPKSVLENFFSLFYYLCGFFLSSINFKSYEFWCVCDWISSNIEIIFPKK